MIALAAGLALIIGWYRDFNLRSLELAAATFAVVLDGRGTSAGRSP